MSYYVFICDFVDLLLFVVVKALQSCFTFTSLNNYSVSVLGQSCVSAQLHITFLFDLCSIAYYVPI